MQKGQNGLWTVTTEPLEPDLYGYSFVVDGTAILDPENVEIKPNLLHIQSVVRVPGSPPLPWEMTAVPHGEIHHHFYKSGCCRRQSRLLRVHAARLRSQGQQPYPVLYLLHGYSDDSSGWTAVGKANLILDNLIAQGKAKPMIIVMPLGYGAPEIVAKNGPGFRGLNFA